MADELSRDDVRRLFLHAQGFIGAPDRRGGVPAMLRRVAAVQLDTISVLARSHELVAYARLGAVGRAEIEAAYWGTSRSAFEYWAHAACVLPIEEWPYFAFRRRRWRERMPARLRAEYKKARALLRHGPITSADFGGAKNAGSAGWWDWSPMKAAVEWLFLSGELVCVERRGWRRVYDLAERAIPAPLYRQDLSDEECHRRLIQIAVRAMGVATLVDIADHFRLPRPVVVRALPDAGLSQVRVRGWDDAAWADPAALEPLGRGLPRGRHRTTLLSPFDSLVWFAPRTERVFGFRRFIEAYVPAAKRVHGYYPMPLLAGGRLIGQIDPGRDGRTLVAKNASIAASEAPVAAAALIEAATWVGCDNVAVADAIAPPLRRALRAALRS